ncbi:MAG: hypothetical protein JG781_2660 [Peptococcaceae bacterium]|jgi:hypothetical protein|nr:hypothetical protein [Peptococcaceae bacterium]
MLYNDDPTNDVFLQNLLYLLGATLLGVKPAELLNVEPYGKAGLRGWQECKHYFADLKDVSFLEVRNLGRMQQVFFYHGKALAEVLKQKATLNFLQSLGYPQEFELDRYVQHLIKKIRLETEFPHEVGIFLGYPLKDVMGFMGYARLPLAGKKGWRYYGNPLYSQRVYAAYEEARERFREVLHSYCSGNL